MRSSADFSELKAEAVAACLLSQGHDHEQLLLKSLGSFRRRFGKDIERIVATEIGNFKGLVLELNRDGIYDLLPEQLFHLKLAPTLSLEEKIREVRKERENEYKSRLFFLPLEQELSLLRIWIEQIEQRSSKLEVSEEFVSLLRNFWMIPEFVSRDWVMKLVNVLPDIAEYSGSVIKTEQLLSNLLGDSVVLRQGLPPELITAANNTRVGFFELGIDAVLPGEISSYIPLQEIVIQLSDINRIPDYLPHTILMRQIEWLITWLFPMEVDVNVKVEIGNEASLFLLDQLVPAAVLGYTTRL